MIIQKYINSIVDFPIKKSIHICCIALKSSHNFELKMVLGEEKNKKQTTNWIVKLNTG